ncbi:hypothetical protein [Adhaeribacter pallidiroseus]|uniref:Uncharacterized protein n=1 Tax=Adhaeribacter pallidiroseus TaxID=2072847 RepID=A0A369QQ01_9BACT|nr:hypothetical protein [Adhaeribacter pallidiroseus]RDC64929.1 hypothetical protein AHMF7616_03551 [Adhaeribacter pallidiroseus]
MKILYVSVLFTGLCLLQHQASGQLLNKMRQKLENAAEQSVNKALGTDKNTINTSTGTSTSSGSRARNKGGAGLVTTPPDVKENLTDAESKYKAGQYAQSRSALQQAMLGVEMEIGQKILKSLPESIAGLKKNAEADQVTSTGWGWVGLTIQRQYTDGNEKELTTTIANNAVLLSAVNLYLTNGGYSQTTGGKQDWKQTKVKGNKAVIEYDESTGYKLTVPLGQSSMLVYEGVNFKNEAELMAAANAVDIAGIKKMLGEK